ncbi:MAG: energy-coupling factor ABC transporter permease [Candidatus Saganbacteria bacterium]|nr:energy-coupling factor ABC transporter permease [Candidatus Saganbacteria bacterium]
MHIPDGFLDPKMSAGMMGAAAVALAYCMAKVRQAVTAVVPGKVMAAAGAGANKVLGGSRRVLTKIGEQKIYKMGMVASLVFAAQMFNFPVSNGTSGHLIGGVLAAVLLGPFAGTIVIATVLIMQSIFFADGGLFTLGANIINMAVVASFGCYYIYYFAKKIMPEWSAVAIASWVSVMLAAAMCSLQIGFSGAIALRTVFLAMIKVHAVIGIAEALITIAFIGVFRRLAGNEDAK